MTALLRALSVTALSVVVVLTVGCTSTDGGSVEATPTETLRSTESSNEPSDIPSDPAPSGKQFEVYTHCGVESTRINGAWWHAKPPLYNKGRSGPPAGWGDPYQTGTLTMVSADRAVFEALGHWVLFVPAPDNQPVRICD